MVLLVVDVQKALTEDDGLYDSGSFIKRIARLIDVARENGTEVVYFQHDAGPGSGLSVGDPDFEIDCRVAPKKGEKVFMKTINSCFGNGEFTSYMNGLEDKSIMVVGLQTNFCIDATVKSAFERGFKVIVPEGTNSTFDNDFMTAETTCRYYFEEIWPDCFAYCVSFDEAIELLAAKIAACGNDCASCPRYNVPPFEKTEEQLHHTAELWMRIGYRDQVVHNDEISCTGCKPDNWCRYHVVDCCKEKGIRTCAECSEYPCLKMKECFEITASFEPMCRKVCTEEEYRQLEKAFFRKEENLS